MRFITSLLLLSAALLITFAAFTTTPVFASSSSSSSSSSISAGGSDERLLTTATPTTAAKEQEETVVNNQCGLYLAPSTLPHAGLGLFSGYNIPHNHSINEYIDGKFRKYDDDNDVPLWTDLFIPIVDDYKALPYRGQQRFPSWLQYIWPKQHGALANDFHSTPDVPHVLLDFDLGLNFADKVEFYTYTGDQKERINAFSPGLASLVNSHVWFSNIKQKESKLVYDKDYNLTLFSPRQSGTGPLTLPDQLIEFSVSKSSGIQAGMELLLNYGRTWHKKNHEKLDWIAEKDNFVNKWDFIGNDEKRNCPSELPTEKAKRERRDMGIANESNIYSENRTNDYHHSTRLDEGKVRKLDGPTPVPSQTQIMKPLSWLNTNGVCLSSGKLLVKKSTIPFAGRGLFVNTHISKDEVVLTSPLLAMREEDFVIYKTNVDEKLPWKIVDKTNVVATELLFNYAFSHPTSPLFLVPNAPLANFINHGKSANVQVRWPKSGSTAAKLFEWTYNQKQGNHYDNSFETMTFNDPNPWLQDHPIDVMERSGKLGLEYVALRDINHGEEILLDYGPLWEMNWDEYRGRNAFARTEYFRQYIGVPTDFFPNNWHNVNSQYEIAEIQDLINKPLKPGDAVPMTWAHNGKPVSSNSAFVVGMEKGFSDKFLKYSEEVGVIELYRKLLTGEEGYILPSDGFRVYKPSTLVNDTIRGNEMEFFAHRFSNNWEFNMHYVSPWDGSARKDVFRALGDAGLDLAIHGISERFGYDNMTCFHTSYMGVSYVESTVMHSDIYATGDKSWTLLFPLITVEGSDPELDIVSENMNTVVGVNYLKDVTFLMGDFGYHQTRPKRDTNDSGVPMRVVFSLYCSQIDETNIAMIRHVYDGDDPAPFADQFVSLPMKEIHWSKDSELCSVGTACGLESAANTTIKQSRFKSRTVV